MYAKAPLVEALCEFHFEAGRPWDLTVPGLFYDKIRNEFPEKRQQNMVSFEVQAEPQGLTHSVASGGIARMQFLRPGGEALVQVGPDNLTINHFKPYPGWPDFKKIIARILAEYREVAHPKGVRRVGLRYINRIEIPSTSVDIDEYIRASPKIPEPIPQIFATWVQRVEIPYESVNAMLALQSGSLHGPKRPHVVFMLDLDFFTLRPEAITLDTAVDWIEMAHNEVENTFEACITPQARQLFEEVSQ